MALGRVADFGDGTYFASVEYDEPGPFCFMTGPEDVSADEAVAWARRHAAQVLVREGSIHYSAGTEPLPGLPPWPSTARDDPAGPATGGVVAWHVRASTGWYRNDCAAVAAQLAEAVGGDARATLDEVGFSVAFTLTARSKVEASERASAAIRAAWSASGVAATPGEDFDVSGISVERRPA